MDDKEMKEYERVVAFGVKNNPKVWMSEKNLLEKFNEMQKDCEAEEDVNAKNIYIQGRNALAFALNKCNPEYKLELKPLVRNEKEGSAEEIVVVIPQKMVAIVSIGKEGVLLKTLDKVLRTTELKNFKVYGDLKVLTEDVLLGRIEGIVSWSAGRSDFKLEGNMRHDLKYFPSFNYEKANTFPLPPIVDLSSYGSVFSDVLTAALEIRSGESKSPESDLFVIGENLSALRTKMLPPKEKMKIFLMDDTIKEVAGMSVLLEVWPNVDFKCQIADTIMAEFDNYIKEVETFEPDILLMDEDLGGPEHNGSELVQDIKGLENCIVASTTGGVCPDSISYHFNQKSFVDSRKNSAIAFINFINKLITVYQGKR